MNLRTRNAVPSFESNTAKVVRRLKLDGWMLERHGSEHDIYKHPVRGAVAVPRHRILSPGVARSIAKAADW